MLQHLTADYRKDWNQRKKEINRNERKKDTVYRKERKKEVEKYTDRLNVKRKTHTVCNKKEWQKFDGKYESKSKIKT